jgi:hypothetical protein
MKKCIRSSVMVSGAIPTKYNAFFAKKIFFRKNIFLFTFNKRQTIEGYGKCMRSSIMVSGTTLTKNNAFFAKNFFP